MNTPATVTRVLSTPQSLTVEWANGEVGEFASLWLRDNLPEDRDPHSGQRLLDIADVPEEPRIRSAVAEDGVVRVEWESDARPASFEFDWLARHAAGSTAHRPELTSTLWLEGAVLDAERDFAHAPWSALRGNPSTRLAWLTRLLQQGIAFLTGVPSNKSAILEAMSLVGRVFETNYGLVFDVQSVPGFQALHALVASREGGDSLFADGFALAEHLRANDAGAFRQLTHNLNDGDLVVFDNQRILHGRTGFSSAQYPRHLRGCYLTRDSVYGETALLRRIIEREAQR
jgi:gamma-butyrobetaine dioxygenase